MRWLIRILIILIVLGAVLAAIIYFMGGVQGVLVRIFGPQHGWDISKKAPAPDYAVAANWAATREAPGLSALTPPGISPSIAQAPVDVFFVHPTGYIHGHDWNSAMDPKSQTEENTQWMMANQASAFNGCCAIYVPRYREASIFRYLDAPEDVATKAMDLAYGDVARAFDHFLKHFSQGRPFIIASHSQGTTHAFRLIQERIDGTELKSRMVAAYVIGAQVRASDMAALKDIQSCQSAQETGCIVHFATFAEGAAVPKNIEGLLCVNPLSWRADGMRAERMLHKGAVFPTGKFQSDFWRADKATGVTFGPLPPAEQALVSAQCRDGLLYVDDLSKTKWSRMIVEETNYHGMEYPLFHMDIRENALERTRAFLSR